MVNSKDDFDKTCEASIYPPPLGVDISMKPLRTAKILEIIGDILLLVGTIVFIATLPVKREGEPHQPTVPAVNPDVLNMCKAVADDLAVRCHFRGLSSPVDCYEMSKRYRDTCIEGNK